MSFFFNQKVNALLAVKMKNGEDKETSHLQYKPQNIALEMLWTFSQFVYNL